MSSRIDRVRPGRATHGWVRRSVAELKAGDPLAPVTLIVPNYYAGRQMRWALATSGGYLNVRAMLLGDLAEAVLAPVANPQEALTPVLEESAVREAVVRVGGALNPVAHHRALHQSLLRLFRELRRSEKTIEHPSTEMARAALAAFSVFQNLVQPYSDRTSIRDRAAQRLLEARTLPRELAELGGLVVTLPPRLDPADIRLLGAAARWVPVRAAFADFAGDELANALPDEAATELHHALVAVAPNETTSLSPAEPPVAVIRAPDPSEEIREVVRAIARDLEGADPIPLHRTAVLYRQTDPYGPLVRDSLTLAEVPWSALEGRTLAEGRPGQALLSLLKISQRDFAREAVLGWMDAAPATRSGPTGAAWDRLSRAANIVRGASQWLSRLDNYAARQTELANQRESEDNAPAASALRYDADLAQDMRADVALLSRNLEPPAHGSAWSDFVAWAEGLWNDVIGGVGAWPEDEAPFAEDVIRTLSELRQADVIERGGTTLALFLITLQATLESRARPVGSLGQGVLIGPVQSVTGLAFKRVYLVGMTEGAFPTPPAEDPFFPSAAEDPLSLREHQRRAERLAFRTALASADGGRVTLSLPDSMRGRKAFPSPWLLELASGASGIRPLFTTAFQTLDAPVHAHWLRVVTSALDGITRAPGLSDLEDRRLREAAAADRLAEHAMARRSDLPLGTALAMSDARGGSDFTPFDGNTEVVVELGEMQRLLQAAQRVSASGIQSWATCPFQFFLGRVLRIDATDRPEDGWTIDPLERGSVVHSILERFFKQLRAAGRFDGADSFSAADCQLLEDIASEQFAELERRGVVGHPLVWEDASATIRSDLRTFLDRDERWRQNRDLQPRFFEQPFGMNRPDSWPALNLLIGGVRVNFRGSIDRVDQDPSGRRAFLYDYKTGSTSTYGGLNDDAVVAGKHIQLALYRRALLAALPDVEDAEGAYWFVTSKGEFKMLPVKTPPDTDRRLSEVLEGTVRGILQGAFPQVPGAETARPGKFSWESCVYCEFDRICPAGRDAVWDRKHESPGYQLHTALAPAAAILSEA